MVYKVTEETVTGIANAIRTKTNSTEDIKVEDFAEEILSINTGENTAAAAESARDAEASAVSAASSATAAAESAYRAGVNMGDATAFAYDSEAWAVGKRNRGDVGPEDITYENNSKYYANQASESAKNANSSLQASVKVANDVIDFTNEVLEIIDDAQGFTAQAWAVGIKDKTAVVEGDPQYQNNAKYYADQTKVLVNNLQKITVAGNIFIEGAKEVTS